MENTDRTLQLPAHFIDRVRVDSLLPADSPRLNGLDSDHVQRLCEIYETLPPILVHRSTRRVIDGMHRIAAAGILGRETVDVQYFDGAEAELFLRAVAANVTHGLPLSGTERKAAAVRILASHPKLSDRAISSCVGLDAKTVAAVRRSTGDSPRVNVRVGSDGRAHPLDRTAERLHAAELLTNSPGLPLRTVVARTGLSLGTAHDVRQRLLRGETPVPAGRRSAPRTAPALTAPSTGSAPSTASASPPASTPRAGPNSPRRPEPPVHPARTRASFETLRKLAGDPSLRHSENGRAFVRWIHTHFVTDDAWRSLAAAVPSHSTDTVAELALQCSDTWKRFAEDLSRRRFSDRSAAPGPKSTSESRHRQPSINQETR
ncbi:transcriptional regulator [Streptomyces sp. NPDC056061]|uniref:transcriptional regulator n=1 Tax=Streptomyces sp. NPDC056061 TaxID=3345700 RepID=UPI0035D5981B